MLAEYGIVIGRQVGHLRRRLPEILEDSENGLTAFGRELFAGLYQELVHLDERIQVCDEQIDRVFKGNEACVALANKNARVAWALMATGDRYQVAA